MINIEEKFFHGINLTNYCEYIGDLTEFTILELILKSKKILSRNDLENIKSPNLSYLNIHHLQKSNEVCLSFHPNNQKYEIKGDIKLEDAFYDFTMYHISIILNEKLINDYSYLITGMPREIRINNSILLPGYIEAIGYYDKIKDMIETINILIENKNYKELKSLFYEVYYRDFLRAKNIKEYIIGEYKKYKEIQKLLKQTGYDIPIIDPFTGKEHANIEDSIINAEKSIKKLSKIKEKIRNGW